MSNAVGGAFNTLTQSISNALTNQLGLLGSFLSAFVSFGLKIVQANIKRLITEEALEKKRALLNKISLANQVVLDKKRATSNSIVAATATAKSSGPAAAFVLPALIAGAVAAVSGAFGKIGGGGGNDTSFASGNLTSGVSGGTSNNFGSSSRFTGSNGGFGEVVFRIAGTDLVGVLENQLEQNLNLGGGSLTI